MTQGTHNPLLQGDVQKVVLRLAGPMALSMVLIGSTPLIDIAFVSRLGTVPLAALGFALPVITIVQQVLLGFGIGVTAAVARRVGAGSREAAAEAARFGLLAGAGGVVALTGGLWASSDLILTALGAQGECLALATKYLDQWLIGSVLYFLTYAGTAALRGIGDTQSTARALFVSSGINVALDPILIFGLGPLPAYGLRGAAIACVLGFMGSTIQTLWALSRASDFPIARGTLRGSGAMTSVRDILRVAGPTIFNYALTPITMAVLTRMLAPYGAGVVAAFGASTRLLGFVRNGPLAVGAALAPFVGQHFAARSFERLAAGVSFGQRLSALWTGGCALAAIACSGAIAAAVAEAPATAKVVQATVVMVALAFLSDGRIIVASSVFNNVGLASRTALVGGSRALLLCIPLAQFGALVAGAYGALAAVPLSTVLADALATVLLRRSKVARAALDAGRHSGREVRATAGSDA